MESFGKTLVVIGLLLVAIGVVAWTVGPRLGSSGGLLPGDLVIKRGSVSFYLPIVTCLILSVLLTLLLRLFNR
ncbi:MAG TPA: DUF2905 domain-containing protein [Verrucomicrobiota bacterium]|nr:DUF2905 domain-containing protein [Verrucomicrobiota bacterium]